LTARLEVQNLTVGYWIDGAWRDAVSEISLSIEAGQTYGLVGESGSGKSTLAQAIMRYLGGNGAVRSGSILLDGEDLAAKSTHAMRELWGAKLGLVPQDPLTSLNPSLTIGEQIAEITRRHAGLDRAEALHQAVETLAKVRIANPEDVARRYPHQLSGGMQQRVVIAMALSTNPALLVLDEPTTNLDVTTEAAVLDLFADLLHTNATAALYVTHNLGLVARMCDRVAVLYAGELMVDAEMRTLFKRPLHPYTISLLGCIPRPGQNKYNLTLQTIPGQPPGLQDRPAGCVFAPRCPVALERCFVEKPALETADDGQKVRCHRWREIADGSLRIEPPAPITPQRGEQAAEESLLTIQGLEVNYARGNFLERILDPGKFGPVKAVDHISLKLPRGQTLGLVGESGSGKTSLARSVAGLVNIESGKIQLLEADLTRPATSRNPATLRHLQMVFQHPEESFNPYHTVGETLSRPLITLAGKAAKEAEDMIPVLLRAVHLPEEYAARLPGELSGGEKQRVAIARAFAAQPDLIICDEPVSALDVSIQASILNLLNELQQERQTAYLFISHDLAVVGYLADKIAVIYLGQIVEISSAEGFFDAPHHPYTEALLSAIPIPDPDAQRSRILLDGDLPDPAHTPTGCRFHTRCPRYLGEVCKTVEPAWHTDAETGRQTRCHIPPEELRALQTAAIPADSPP
jgi:peptide/nickel transport system ATP-binding protein